MHLQVLCASRARAPLECACIWVCSFDPGCNTASLSGHVVLRPLCLSVDLPVRRPPLQRLACILAGLGQRGGGEGGGGTRDCGCIDSTRLCSQQLWTTEHIEDDSKCTGIYGWHDAVTHPVGTTLSGGTYRQLLLRRTVMRPTSCDGWLTLNSFPCVPLQLHALVPSVVLKLTPQSSSLTIANHVPRRLVTDRAKSFSLVYTVTTLYLDLFDKAWRWQAQLPLPLPLPLPPGQFQLRRVMR